MRYARTRFLLFRWPQSFFEVAWNIFSITIWAKTIYEYGQDGLPTRRTNALGHTFGYHYDKARRLVGLTNENGARYRFAYDVLDRLIAESGFDHKLTGYRYNAGNELVEQREFGDDATLAAKLMAQLGGQPVPKKDAVPLSDDLDSQTPLRITEFKRDILGRLIHTLARNDDQAQETAYQYDPNGNLVRAANLTHSTDQRTGTTRFEYDKLGRITQAGNELFAFDPAHNILSDDLNAVPDNRLKTYNGTTYYYDELGNLIHRELADGEVQNYFYDLHDQLVKAEIFKKDGTKETWSYTYDALGRRIGKGRLKNEEVSETSFPHDLSGNDLDNQTRFVWDGSHLLQEIQPDGRYTYIYTDPDSYEPLAQVHDWTTEDGESRQQTHYFHCDQIGIPREMTDKDGNLLWFGNYTGWGRLKEENKVTDSAYQPFRLQNQYADLETGLHYNFFRYYESDCGRFINQDPIGLKGSNNLYTFAPNVQISIDPLGLAAIDIPLPANPASEGIIIRAAATLIRYSPTMGLLLIVSGDTPQKKEEAPTKPVPPAIAQNNANKKGSGKCTRADTSIAGAGAGAPMPPDDEKEPKPETNTDRIEAANKAMKDMDIKNADIQKGSTRNSSTQVEVHDISQEQAINNLVNKGFTRTRSTKTPDVSVLKKGDTQYTFYPRNTGRGMPGKIVDKPSASIYRNGDPIPVKIRFTK